MNDEHIPRRVTSSFVIVIVIAFVVLSIEGYYVSQTRNLIAANRQRIVDIQESRVSSCKQTYEGVREVLIPLFPPPPRTKTQQDSYDKLNQTVNQLKRRCSIQTFTPKK